MSVISIYRMLIAIRGCWWLIGLCCGWGLSADTRSSISLHPHAAAFADLAALAVYLTILVGLWFFRRWARFLFIVSLFLIVASGALRSHESTTKPPRSLAPVGVFVTMIGGA